MADDLNGWGLARRLEEEVAVAVAVEEMGPWRRGVEVEMEIEERERWRVEREVRVRRRRREYNNAIAGGCGGGGAAAAWSCTFGELGF